MRKIFLIFLLLCSPVYAEQIGIPKYDEMFLHYHTSDDDGGYISMGSYTLQPLTSTILGGVKGNGSLTCSSTDKLRGFLSTGEMICDTDTTGGGVDLTGEGFITFSASTPLINERVLSNGTNTTVDTGTAGLVKINLSGTHGNSFHTASYVIQSDIDTSINTHKAVTSSVHNFDVSGNAPAQTHDNGKHSATYITVSSVTDANLTTTDVTTNNTSTTKHGFFPKLPNTGGTTYFNDAGTWTTPAGGSGLTATVLTGNVTQVNGTAYTTIFTIPLTASKMNIVDVFLAQYSSLATVGVQNRGRIDTAGQTGYCDFDSVISVSNKEMDTIAVVVSPADTASSAALTNTPYVNKITCSIIATVTPGNLIIDFQAETTGTVTTKAGSYYTKVTN